jgi:hypothetical protein
VSRMFLQQRARVVGTWVVGVVIFFVASTLIIATGVKQLHGPLTQNLVSALYWSVPPFRWLWPWLPDATDDVTAMVMSGPFLLGIGLMLIAVVVVRNAQNGHAIIQKAIETFKVAGLVDGKSGSRNNQTVGHINAGGDVNIKQIADANRQLDNWDNNFWTGPVGGLLLGAAAIVIAAIITSLTGLTH